MTTLSVSKPASLQTSIFDDFTKPWRDWIGSFYDGNPFNGFTVPAVNVTEDKDSYKLSLAAPGMKKEDFKIQLEGSMLTISAEKEEKKEEKNEKYRRQEYNYSSFTRSFNVPESISKDKIEAHYEDGVLKMRLPKNEESKKNGKSIAIAVK
ncbi:Hsp20/alpha crystallin family protein [Chitinophaga polysaccharea]|uniref:Hsp20/alpha crystallin family protein n=1 Tax=Chitinophaga TaxID=79328 RepID=UPI00145568B3|nr:MULTISPECIES: Hsp20/alpha crystallin family protein [Chitinophaga]NLR60350.1 Hsp20/alpha crystallin family protein [Chitinophaga polysaccharea]NLU95991.1 Hsp20/alpha crystallin family protein [Chitinophaga sp. Ak27]